MSPTRPWSLLALKLVAAVVLTSRPEAVAYEAPAKFLIVSNAQTGLVQYGSLPVNGGNLSMHTLIEAFTGLQHPQGLAVDQKRKLLLIADTGLRKIVSYGLSLHGGKLHVDEQTPVAEDVEARWVVADGTGNVYFSDEAGSKIFTISAQDVSDGNTKPSEVFDSSVSVSGPGGVAADNFYVYWTNKVGGKQTGSVVRALVPRNAKGGNNAAASLLDQSRQQSLSKRRLGRQAGAAQTVQVLESNTDKSYGLCLAVNQMFYTDPEKNVWAANKTGGDPVAITSKLSSPRGCAWDGLNTLYVADRSLGGIYSFQAPMYSLAETKLTRVADAEEAFGLAVFSKGRRGAASAWPVLLIFLSLLHVASGNLRQ